MLRDAGGDAQLDAASVVMGLLIGFWGLMPIGLGLLAALLPPLHPERCRYFSNAAWNAE